MSELAAPTQEAIIGRLERLWSDCAARAEVAFFAGDTFKEDFWDGRARGIRLSIEAVKEEIENSNE